MRDVTFRTAQNLRVVAAPAQDDLPISVDEARRHSNIDTLDDEPLLKRFILTARNWLQGPNGWLGVSISRQTLRLDLPCFWYSPLRLRCGPIVAVSSVKYFDADNAEQTIDPGDYFLDEDQLLWGPTFQEPTCFDRPSAVRVQYTAGFADPAALQAAGYDPVLQAIHMLVAHWYENREAVLVVGELNMMPAGVYELLTPFRELA